MNCEVCSIHLADKIAVGFSYVVFLLCKLEIIKEYLGSHISLKAENDGEIYHSVPEHHLVDWEM